MNVTDPQRAGAASTLIVAGLAANLCLTLLSYVINGLVPGSYEGLWPIAQELFWLGATVVLVMGLFQLAGAVNEGALLNLAGGALIFSSLLGLGQTLFDRLLGGGFVSVVVNDGSMLLALIARGLLIVAMVQLTMKTHAWVLALLGMVAVLTVMRSSLTIAMVHQLIDYELYRSPIFRFALPAVSIFNAVAMVVSGLGLKAAIPTGPGVVGTPALVAAAGLRPAEPEPISPAADFLVGGILLVVGIGVTVVSMEAASNGGRYVVATGAIGVGIGRIIRGLMRLARGT